MRALCRAGLAWAASLSAASAAPAVDYADVAAIFGQRCVVCHRGPGAPLGLHLDSLEGIRMGSARGPVARPGDPEGSELVRRIKGISQPRMPLTGPPYLSEVEIQRIVDWIQAGMPAVRAVQAAAPRRRSGPGEPVRWPDVESILLQRCVKCHADRGQMGGPPEGLRLKTLAQVLAGGERVVVVPGSPGASELVRRIRGQALPRMPFDGPPYLSEDEVGLISDWVEQGARDAGGRVAQVPVGRRVRLHGRLTGHWALDGLPLRVGPGTRLRRVPGIGGYARVRGVVQPDGGILATRIRAR